LLASRRRPAVDGAEGLLALPPWKRKRVPREDDSIGITKSARADAMSLKFLWREADERSITLFSRLDCNLPSKKLASFSLPLLSLSLSHTLTHTLSRSGLAKTTMREASGAARGLWSM